MAVVVKFNDNTEQEMKFNSKDGLRWFLGMQDLTKEIKVIGYKVIK